MRWARGDVDIVDLLTRSNLPSGFERWELVLSPGAEQAADASDWAGALVYIACGSIEVECRAGGRQAFAVGQMLPLGELPLRTLHNPSPLPARLVAVRRRGGAPPPGGLSADG